MDGWTEFLPILQDFVPCWGRCPATLWDFTTLKKQGKGTADLMMPFGDWFLLGESPKIVLLEPLSAYPLPLTTTTILGESNYQLLPIIDTRHWETMLNIFVSRDFFRKHYCSSGIAKLVCAYTRTNCLRERLKRDKLSSCSWNLTTPGQSLRKKVHLKLNNSNKNQLSPCDAISFPQITVVDCTVWWSDEIRYGHRDKLWYVLQLFPTVRLRSISLRKTFYDDNHQIGTAFEFLTHWKYYPRQVPLNKLNTSSCQYYLRGTGRVIVQSVSWQSFSNCSNCYIWRKSFPRWDKLSFCLWLLLNDIRSDIADFILQGRT